MLESLPEAQHIMQFSATERLSSFTVFKPTPCFAKNQEENQAKLPSSSVRLNRIISSDLRPSSSALLLSRVQHLSTATDGISKWRTIY